MIQFWHCATAPGSKLLDRKYQLTKLKYVFGFTLEFFCLHHPHSKFDGDVLAKELND